MSIERELSDLVGLLETVAERVEGLGREVSGESPTAQENRAIRAARADIARHQAREVRAELEEVRRRAREMAARATATGDAVRAGHADGPAAPSPTTLRGLQLTARRLSTVEDRAGVSKRVVEEALQVVPGAEGATMLLRDGGGAAVRTGAGLEPGLDELWTDLDTGPFADTVADGTPAYVPDLRSSTRWPALAARASELGVRTVLATPVADAEHPGCLVLWAAGPDAFDATSRMIAELLVDHAVIAFGGARRVDNLGRAVEHRDLIGQAKGILMCRHGIGATEAFQMLVRASQDTNMKLIRVATWVVNTMASDRTAQLDRASLRGGVS